VWYKVKNGNYLLFHLFESIYIVSPALKKNRCNLFVKRKTAEPCI